MNLSYLDYSFNKTSYFFPAFYTVVFCHLTVNVSITHHSQESSSNSSIFNIEQRIVGESLGTVCHALKMNGSHTCMVKLVQIILTFGHSLHEQSVSNGFPDSENVQYKPKQNVILVIILKMDGDLVVRKFKRVLSSLILVKLIN